MDEVVVQSVQGVLLSFLLRLCSLRAKLNRGCFVVDLRSGHYKA